MTSPHPILTDMHSSGGRPSELSHQQSNELREWLSTDLFAFAWFIMDYRDLIPEIHGRISSLLEKWGSPGWERVMVQIPREFFKTSLCTRANSLWQVVRDPDSPIAIFNERIDNSAKFLRAVRDVVQSNEMFQSLWPELLPPGIARNDNRTMPRWWKWSDTELLFNRGKIGIPEASITALGVGAAAAGGHWPKIIKDDLISEDAAQSVSVMEAMKEWFDKSLYLERPALKGWDLVVCTPWSYDDLYSYVLKKYNYKLYRRAALEDKDGKPDTAGQSTFPQKLTTDDLTAQYERDPYGFSSQMMCRPRPGRDMSFEHKWLRYGEMTTTIRGEAAFAIDRATFDAKSHLLSEDENEVAPRVVPLYAMEKVILVDPAPSEEGERKRERNSRTSLVVEGIDPWGRRYILDVWAERQDPMVIIEAIFSLMKEWGTDKVCIEEVSFTKVYRQWLRVEASRRGIAVSTVALKPEKRSKDTRITAKIPACKQGIYYLNRMTTQKFVQEYLEYPYGATRDIIDAWAYSDDVLRRPQSPLEVEVEIWQDEALTTKDRHTGY